MYLTVSTTHRPATDLGYLLHKHPDRAQRFDIAGGTAHVFYPQATDERCTAALFCDIDPINLVRGRHNTTFSLGQYVNDRPYAAGSLLAVAMGTVFKSAMKGVSARQELADTAIPLEIGVPALPGGAALVRDLFAPLGWQVAEVRGPRVPSESLAVQRRRRVVELLTGLGAARVADLGCGAGALLRELVTHPQFTDILGVDVSAAALDAAARSFERAGDRVRGRVTLRQSALTYADPSLAGYDAAALMEVIEHIDETRLPALHYAVFGVARPRAVIVTTPNADYNVRFDALPAGQFRHLDHRFEWNRAEFGRWAAEVADRYGYTVGFESIGPEDPELGPPTQAAVFEVTA